MIEQVSSNLYKFSHVSKESIFGGDSGGLFKPKLSLDCFLGKGRLALLPQLLGTFSPTISGESLLIDHSIFAIRMTPTPVLSGFNEYGGIDFVITLKKKPPTNKISLGYDSTNLVAYHQPELTVQEISEGAKRPDHVVNSIAFYHSSKGGLVAPTDVANRITTGKALHLYRLKATAAGGSWIYTNWELGTGNTIILSVDQTFLNTKPYPIVLAPVADTFGYTTAGASSAVLSNLDSPIGSMQSSRLAASGDTITQFAVYCNAGSERTAYVAAYTIVSGVPAARLAAGEAYVYPTSVAWAVTGTVSQAMVANSTYNVAVDFPAGGGVIYYDTLSGALNSTHDTVGALPATWTSVGTNARAYSWYATYTAGGFLPKIIFM